MIRLIAILGMLVGLGGCQQPNNLPTDSASFASGSVPPATAQPGSTTEVAFAKAMWAHQQQTIELADIALARPATSLEVRQIAAENRRAAVTETQTLQSWLQAWGHAVPAGTAGALGMLSAEQVAKVRGADESRLDQLWMQAMATHHRGAIAMARQIQGSSGKLEVRRLAAQVVQRQRDEIGQLQILVANAAVQ